MPILDGMSLDEVVAGFPELAPAVECIRPHLGLFDGRTVFIEKERRYFEVDSTLSLPWVDTAIQRWTARFHADRVAVFGHERVPNVPNTFRGVGIKAFTFDEFATLLGKVSDHQKKAGKSRGGRKPLPK